MSGSMSSVVMASRSASASSRSHSFVGPHLSGICAEGAAAAAVTSTVVHSSALRLCSVYLGSNALACIANSGVIRHMMKLAAPVPMAHASVFMAAAQSTAVEQLGYRFALRVLVHTDGPSASALQALFQYLLSQVEVQTLEVLGSLPVQDVLGVAALGSVLPLLVGLAVQEALLVSDVIAGRATLAEAASASVRHVATGVGSFAGTVAGAALGSLIVPAAGVTLGAGAVVGAGAGVALGSLVGMWAGARALRSFVDRPMPFFAALPFAARTATNFVNGSGSARSQRQASPQPQSRPQPSSSAAASWGCAANSTFLGRPTAAASVVGSRRGAKDGAVKFYWGPGQFEDAIAVPQSRHYVAAADLPTPAPTGMGSVADALKGLFSVGEKLSDAEAEGMWAAQQSEAAVREKSRANLGEYQRVRATPPASGKKVGAQELVLFFSQPPPPEALPAQAVSGLAAAAVAAGAAAMPMDPAPQVGSAPPGFGFTPPASSSASVQASLPWGAVPSEGFTSSAKRALHRSSVRFDERLGQAAVEGVDALSRRWLS
jgi:hypothetical protein